jgi:hypothetical protein
MRRLLGLGAFSVCYSYTQLLGLFRRGFSPSQSLRLHTGQQKQNTHTQTSMPRVGFEPTILVFERTKTVDVLDRASDNLTI